MEPPTPRPLAGISGQIWMVVILANLAAGLPLVAASKPIFALVGVGAGEFWYCPCPAWCLPSPPPCPTTSLWSQTQNPKGLPREPTPRIASKGTAVSKWLIAPSGFS